MANDPDVSIALNAAVQKIKLGYLRDLDQRILDLEALRQMVIRGDRPDHALKEIALRAHKIRGVAATLGLPALGIAAAQVDDAYSVACAENPPSGSLRDTVWPALEPLVESLLDQMERALD